MAEMAARYESGATAYELAAEFECHRTTVTARLNMAGVTLRLQSPKLEIVDVMSKFYENEQTLRAVGECLGLSSNTVRTSLKLSGIEIRDTHGRVC